MSPLEFGRKRITKPTEVPAEKPLHNNMMDLVTPAKFTLEPDGSDPEQDTVRIFNYLGPFSVVKGPQINEDPHCQRHNIKWKKK